MLLAAVKRLGFY